MEEKITMPMLISLLSEKSGLGRKQCEDFIREFINVVIEGLSAGESVRIKGIGLFKIVTVGARKSVDVNTGRDFEIPEHNKVVFVPAAELADRVNAPFDMFDTVEIDDDFSEDFLEELDNSSDDFKADDFKEVSDETSAMPEETQPLEKPMVSAPIPESISEPITETDVPVEIERVAVHDPVESEKKEYESIECESINEETEEEKLGETKPELKNQDEEQGEYLEDETDNESSNEVVTQKKRRGVLRFWVGIACGLILGFGTCILIGYLLGYLPFEQKESQSKIASVEMKTPDKTEKETVVEEVPSVDALVDVEALSSDVATQPSDIVVYDTITHTRYLTTMAKAHYGNYNLWPYIYEENSSFLGHPDRIRPGTRVVIPDLKKYGVRADNPEDIKKAKAKGVAIYARYGS